MTEKCVREVPVLSIVFWMNQPSHYQTAFFLELTGRAGVTLKVVYAHGLTAERQQLGWTESVPAPGTFDEMTLSGVALGTVTRIAWRERRSVHIINGVWAERPFIAASLALRIFGANYMYHSEAPNPGEERKGLANPLKRRFGRWMIARAKGMFLIGSKACDYYAEIGARSESRFKFCYFLPTPSQTTNPELGAGQHRSTPTLLYLGQFVARKRVHDLIEALAILRARDVVCRLRLVGAGPLRAAYVDLAQRLGVADLISVEPPIAPAAVPGLMAQVDCLGLVSEFDGWGLVVNEALQNARPVIVSQGCGVAELVAAQPTFGRVVAVGSPTEIADSFILLVSGTDQFPPAHPDIATVDSKVGCRAMTDYFIACVRYSLGQADSRPVLAW